MPISDENKLDIWWPDAPDSSDIDVYLRCYLEQVPGSSVYGVALTPDGFNLIGHAPRPTIEALKTIQTVFGFRVVDHAFD
jgi:hypothetical protein